MRLSRPRVIIIWGLAISGAAIVASGIGWGIARGWPRGDADLVQRAKAAYASQDWAGAADLARRRLKTVPADVEALRMLARATGRLGRDASANAMFARLGAEAMQAEDFYLLGIGLSHAGQRAQAERMWERALAENQDHAEALNALARAYAASSRPDEAARLAERLAHQPGWELQGELIWGALRFELDDPAGAAEVLARALRRPESGRLDESLRVRDRKLIARALLRVGKPGEARGWLDGIPGASTDPEASWLLSRAALQEGAIPEAVAALRSAGSYRDEHRLEHEPGPYAGEARCAECHSDIAAAQKASRHASTLVRGADLARIPYPDGPIPDPDNPQVVHRFHRDGDSIRFESEASGAIRSAIVAYAFGSPDRYVSLVGPDDQGREYILRLSHYTTAHDAGWVRTTGHTADATGGNDYLGKPLDGPDALYKCLFCHATSPRAVLDGTEPASRDRAIGCERCHGPGELHIKASRARLNDLAIVNPARASAEERLRLCAQCHGYHLPSPSPPPRTDPFWIRFQGTTLTWSRCYTESAGALDCMTCHDPHHDAKSSESEQIARCLDCHSPAPSEAKVGPGVASGQPVRLARGGTCPVNPTRGCIGCHMPPFESAPLHATFTDHFIRIHPERTDRSVHESPNGATRSRQRR
jgi:tetratricopeptide (TPR) repeat protein